jgi:acetyl-CoA carboxylase biotin carboxylase subunit
VFRKVLIANRGEIALRVIRACKELGVRTVAVYSEADRWAAHVAEADEAYLLGPPPSAESYLRMDRILEIAKKTAAEAIHPGYGFLAENAEFADACAKAKVKFIGPGGDAIRKAGNKIRARVTAEKNDIPVIPGVSRGVSQKEAAAFGKQHGFPILLKAASGGGGRGMRVVPEKAALKRAFREASAEAGAAFGDDTLFIEKYIAKPRHVEIQILADAKGNVVHLGERECSIQRRYQKLIEESPSPAVDGDLRARMGATACRIAKLVGYENAGTVEFLLDPAGGFYFMEVNSRLQVEHPVTEMVTGLDLVEEQLRIASGRKLRRSQDEIVWRGHAMEARICSEDPFADFAPSTGEIVDVRIPAGPFVRCDHAIAPHAQVPIFYDSLIAKLICWGPDRRTTLKRMERALEEFVVIGVQTTIPFHLRLLQDRRFREGAFHTRFVEDEFELRAAKTGNGVEAAIIAAALEKSRRERATPKYASPRPLSAWKMSVFEQ